MVIRANSKPDSDRGEPQRASPPPQILAIAVDAPRYTISGEEAERLLRSLATQWERRPEPLVRILQHTGIETRHTVYEGDAVIAEHTLGERNRRYIETSLEMGEQVVRRALQKARLEPRDIDAFISVSCTGFMLPSIDAYLMNRLGMKPEMRRQPITELGCAAGAVALSRAREQLQVYPRSHVLLLSIELPSLTFQPNDRRLSQLVSSMIFADGAAAVVLGPGGQEPGLALIASRTYTIPGTLDEMGYDLDEAGFHIVLTPAVPDLIKNSIRPQVAALLEEQGAGLSDLRWCAMHPAGPKVLVFAEEALNLTREQLAPSWKVLKEYGNMSSASVLFVLDEMLRNSPPRPGELGAIVAFGPGVSGEIVLARWEG